MSETLENSNAPYSQRSVAYTELEKFITEEINLGFPIKYSKPIGFKKERK